jgi:chitinase
VSASGQGQAGFARNWNAAAGEPWLFNPAATHQLGSGTVVVATTICYSDPVSIGERTSLVKALDLRGAMAWEISQDSDDHALIGALSPILK